MRDTRIRVRLFLSFDYVFLPLESRKRRCCSIATAWDAQLRRCAIFTAGIPGEEDLRTSSFAYVRFDAFFFDNLFTLGHDLASQCMIYKYSRLCIRRRDARATHVHKYVVIVQLETNAHGKSINAEPTIGIGKRKECCSVHVYSFSSMGSYFLSGADNSSSFSLYRLSLSSILFE